MIHANQKAYYDVINTFDTTERPTAFIEFMLFCYQSIPCCYQIEQCNERWEDGQCNPSVEADQKVIKKRVYYEGRCPDSLKYFRCYSQPHLRRPPRRWQAYKILRGWLLAYKFKF